MSNIENFHINNLKNNLNFKSCCINYKILLPFSRLPIKELNGLTAKVTIDNYRVISVTKGLSNEGIISTGSALLIKGSIDSVLQYIEFSNTYLSSFKTKIPFSTIIPIVEKDTNCNDFLIHPIIEFKSIYLLKNRLVHSSIGLTLIAKNYTPKI